MVKAALFSPRFWLAISYLTLFVVQVIALVDPSQLARDRSLGVPGLDVVVAVTFGVAALVCAVGQFAPKIPTEYVGLPILSLGYLSFGLGSMVAAYKDEPGGSVLSGLVYVSWGALLHTRWLVQRIKFQALMKEQADRRSANPAQGSSSDTSIRAPRQ